MRASRPRPALVWSGPKSRHGVKPKRTISKARRASLRRSLTVLPRSPAPSMLMSSGSSSTRRSDQQEPTATASARGYAKTAAKRAWPAWAAKELRSMTRQRSKYAQRPISPRRTTQARRKICRGGGAGAAYPTHSHGHVRCIIAFAGRGDALRHGRAIGSTPTWHHNPRVGGSIPSSATKAI